MPSPIVWSSRRPLYKLTLVLLIAVAPVNLLSLVLPHWLQTKAVVSYGDQGKETMKDVVLSYGIWRLCSDTFGCRGVHDAYTDAGVGVWMYPIKLFMVLSVLCHVFAVTCGVMQNFLRRDQLRRFRFTLWKKVVHRDCPYTEDIGFIAGFLGTLSCIIFMLGTKDRMSGGAHYEWGFAFAFMSSCLTVLATLTLTKTHIMTAPRPPTNTNRRNGSQPDSSDSGRDRGASASPSPTPQAVVRTDDIRLEERQRAAQAEASASSRRSGTHFRSSITTRRRRSRSRSRSMDRQSSSRQASGHVFLNQSRLTRSPELENIPAAVTPSEPSVPLTAAPIRSRTAPVMCLQMSDLQNRAVSSPVNHTASASTSHLSSAASSPQNPGDLNTPSSSNARGSDSSRKKESLAHQRSDLHRTQSEAVVVLPSDDSFVSSQGSDSVAPNKRKSTHDDSVVTEGVDVVESERL